VSTIYCHPFYLHIRIIIIVVFDRIFSIDNKIVINISYDCYYHYNVFIFCNNNLITIELIVFLLSFLVVYVVNRYTVVKRYLNVIGILQVLLVIIQKVGTMHTMSPYTSDCMV